MSDSADGDLAKAESHHDHAVISAPGKCQDGRAMKQRTADAECRGGWRIYRVARVDSASWQARAHRTRDPQHDREW